MSTQSLNVENLRAQFPALQREHNGEPVVYFDGPAGSQVPQCVIDAISNYLSNHNANHEGPFLTSQESDAVLDMAHEKVATFVGADSGESISFGANMTSLTMALSRAMARTWDSGDEIIVSRLDHDANVTPWVLAAADAGVTVRHIEICEHDCTLDLDDFRSKLNQKTRLVAVGLASNATGTINPVETMVRKAHEFGAQTFIDAVHFAPHGLVDVKAIDCDFLACSAYKFFGPHVGILYGEPDLLAELQPYKLRPATDDLPGRWMTGTQNHECIAGVAACVDYMIGIGRGFKEALSDRSALARAFEEIVAYEQQLSQPLIEGLIDIQGLKLWGVTDEGRANERVPTISFTHEKFSPQSIAEHLASCGIFVWPGNHYAYPFTSAMNLEPEGTLRIGLLHYNTATEVDRLLNALDHFLHAEK